VFMEEVGSQVLATWYRSRWNLTMYHAEHT
jgi:hypothetical protein